MKMSIGWHKSTLINSKVSEQRYREEACHAIKRYKRIKKENEFKEYQIKEAERDGRDSFDDEKYRIKTK